MNVPFWPMVGHTPAECFEELVREQWCPYVKITEVGRTEVLVGVVTNNQNRYIIFSKLSLILTEIRGEMKLF